MVAEYDGIGQARRMHGRNELAPARLKPARAAGRRQRGALRATHPPRNHVPAEHNEVRPLCFKHSALHLHVLGIVVHMVAGGDGDGDWCGGWAVRQPPGERCQGNGAGCGGMGRQRPGWQKSVPHRSGRPCGRPLRSEGPCTDNGTHGWEVKRLLISDGASHIEATPESNAIECTTLRLRELTCRILKVPSGLNRRTGSAEPALPVPPLPPLPPRRPVATRRPATHCRLSSSTAARQQ